jgi:tetratricopeptide (TPR) repeat protein
MSAEDKTEVPDAFLALLEQWREAAEGQDQAKAESLGVQMLAMAAADQSQKNDPHLRIVLGVREREAACRWEEAEAGLRRALELSRATGAAMMIFKDHHDLSGLFSLLGRDHEALAEARAAAEAARREECPPLLLMAMERLAGCLLACKDPAGALAAAEEMLSGTPEETLYGLQRGRGLVLRARCRVEVGDLDGAQADLGLAREVLGPDPAPSMLAGIQNGFARWWQVAAAVGYARGYLAGAVEALRRAVEERHHLAGSPYGRDALARTLHRLGTALEAAGEPAPASAAFIQSRNLREELGLPPLAAD